MKHLSVFTTHVFNIELENYNDFITLVPFGDVHRFAPNCDTERWKWFREKAKKYERAYFIGMGDYMDFASAREGEKLKSIGLHKTTMETLEELVQKQNRAFAGEISFMRDRLIGLIGGNHTWINDHGITSDEDIANRLGTTYLGWVSVVKLRISFKNTGTIVPVYIVACHGIGGGRTLGASVRKVEDLFQIFPFADIYMMGHDHQKGAWPQTRLTPIEKKDGTIKMKQQRQYYCRTGSFQKSYEEGTGGYATGKLMRPSDLGTMKIQISFHRDRSKGDDRLITDIEATT